MAQTDYNPSNPPEPSARYKITVSASPNYGYTSGTGWFDTGSQTWIHTSSYSPDYIFNKTDNLRVRDFLNKVL